MGSASRDTFCMFRLPRSGNKDLPIFTLLLLCRNSSPALWSFWIEPFELLSQWVKVIIVHTLWKKTKPTYSLSLMLNFGEFHDKIMISVKFDRCKNRSVLQKAQISVLQKARTSPADHRKQHLSMHVFSDTTYSPRKFQHMYIKW